MVVGICRIGLLLRDCHSLKQKRQVVRKIVDRTRHKFSVAIAEVGDNDVWQQGRIGFAAVGNDRRFVMEVVDKVISFIDGLMLAELFDREVEVVQLGRRRQGLGLGTPTDWRSMGELEEAATEGEDPGPGAESDEGDDSLEPVAGLGPAADPRRSQLLARLREARRQAQRGQRDEAADAYARELGSRTPGEPEAGGDGEPGDGHG